MDDTLVNPSDRFTIDNLSKLSILNYKQYS